jgi:CMP-N-acetylneuraminic acid synthetase
VHGRYVALIPARGGSEGVPRKNLARVGTKSLIERAVSSARGVDGLGSCYVSSDDDEILEHAGLVGAIPHRRSAISATNSSRASEVVTDFLDQHPELADDDVLVYLQPTSPFRTAQRVSEALQLYQARSTQSLVSVVHSHQLPSKSLKIAESGLLQLVDERGDPGANRQTFDHAVYPNGAIYVFSVASFRESGDIQVVGALPFIMGKVESLDIDDPDDLMIARAVADGAGI